MTDKDLGSNRQGDLPTCADFAARLTGCEYREEGSRELWAEMKAAGCVAVFGASDDLIEFRGSIDDEVGAYGGATVRVTPTGLLDPDDDLYNRDEKAAFPTISARWCDEDEPAWTYATSIPHSTFEVFEDGEVYCRGIVFALSEAATASAVGTKAIAEVNQNTQVIP